MSGWAANRFWTSVAVAEAGEGFEVRLDARPGRTPGKTPLILPTRALAEALAAEWEAQEDIVSPATMPFTRLANSTIDRVATQFDEVAEIVAAYGETDLICYRATEPRELVARQAAAWDPLIDWARERYGVALRVTEGVVPVAQSEGDLVILANAVRERDAFSLTALHELVSLSGSLVAGLAVTETARTAAEIWDISRIDEEWQAELWGRDAESEDVTFMRKEGFMTAARYLELSRPVPR